MVILFNKQLGPWVLKDLHLTLNKPGHLHIREESPIQTGKELWERQQSSWYHALKKLQVILEKLKIKDKSYI